MLVALMEEYKRAAIDLIIVLEMLSRDEYDLTRDPHTNDPDCRSVATVCGHILRSGYIYASYLGSKSDLEWQDYREVPPTPQRAILELNKMLDYTQEIVDKLSRKSAEEIAGWSFETRWNTTYDTEQLLEHAIVHVLRHRRQIENFLAERS
jgi:uncharacterized damage-inducible protein DinB